MQAALVGSVDASRAVLAIGTGRGRGPERGDDGDLVGRRYDPFDRKAGGDQRQDAFGQGNPAVTADLTDGQPASPMPDATQSAGEPNMVDALHCRFDMAWPSARPTASCFRL